jgi:hypothetical protein
MVSADATPTPRAALAPSAAPVEAPTGGPPRPAAGTIKVATREGVPDSD